jgi:hypothetical protein
MAVKCPRCGGWLRFETDRAGRVREVCDDCVPARRSRHAAKLAAAPRLLRVGEGNCLGCDAPLDYRGRGPRDRYCAECREAKMRAYWQRPDVKAKQRAYRQRPDVKAKMRADRFARVPGPQCHRCHAALPRTRGRPPRLCPRCRRKA